MHYDEAKKMALGSQIVWPKEISKLSHGGPSYSQASGTNPLNKALRQSRYGVWYANDKKKNINNRVYFHKTLWSVTVTVNALSESWVIT